MLQYITLLSIMFLIILLIPASLSDTDTRWPAKEGPIFTAATSEIYLRRKKNCIEIFCTKYIYAYI